MQSLHKGNALGYWIGQEIFLNKRLKDTDKSDNIKL